MVFQKDQIQDVAASAWGFIPLIYDTIVIGLTLYRLVPTLRDKTNRPSYNIYVVTRLLQDGIIYFCVILAITLALALMIAEADQGRQNILGQTEFLFVLRVASLLHVLTSIICDRKMRRLTVRLSNCYYPAIVISFLGRDDEQDHFESAGGRS
jgi:hypothetical protein